LISSSDEVIENRWIKINDFFDYVRSIDQINEKNSIAETIEQVELFDSFYSKKMGLMSHAFYF